MCLNSLCRVLGVVFSRQVPHELAVGPGRWPGLSPGRLLPLPSPVCLLGHPAWQLLLDTPAYSLPCDGLICKELHSTDDKCLTSSLRTSGRSYNHISINIVRHSLVRTEYNQQHAGNLAENIYRIFLSNNLQVEGRAQMFLIFTFSWLKPSWRLKIVMITGNKWLQYFCVDIGAINVSAPPFPLPFEVGVVGAMVDCLLVVGGQQHRQPWPLRLMSDCTHCTVANHQSKQHLLSLKTLHYFHYFNNLRYVNCFHFTPPLCTTLTALLEQYEIWG